MSLLVDQGRQLLKLIGTIGKAVNQYQCMIGLCAMVEQQTVAPFIEDTAVVG